MGFFANLFRALQKPPVNVDGGLDYRVINRFKVAVLISPEWSEDGRDDAGKPKQRTVSAIKKFNATAVCITESEASGVLSVLENMEHFCEHCGEEVYLCDKKCDGCKKPLWKGSKKLEMVVVHVTP